MAELLSRLMNLLGRKKGDSLSRQVALGSFWRILTEALARLFSMVYVIVMARLLTPEDFGVMGLVTLTVNTLDMLTALGLGNAIIQMKKGMEIEYLDAAWTAGIVRSLVLFSIIFASAPWVAVFYKSPSLTGLLRFVALAVFIGGFTNIGRMYFWKDMDFSKLFLEQLGKSVVDILLLIPLALVLRNVWALVIGYVVKKIVAVLLSYRLHPYRPHLEFNLIKIRYMFRYGKWLLGMQVLKIISDMGDQALIGRTLGTTSLGYYRAAYRFGDEPAKYAAKIVSGVMFPAYAKIQDDRPRLRRVYLSVFELLISAGLPLICGVVFLGEMFVLVFLEARWLPIVPLMGIMVVSGVLKSVIESGASLFLGVGQPNKSFSLKIIRAISLVLVVYPLTLWGGIQGTALGVLIGYILLIPLWSIYLMRITGLHLSEYMRVSFPAFIAVLPMALSMQALTSICPPGLLSFLAIGSVSSLLYFLVLYLLWRLSGVGPYQRVLLIARRVL